MPGDRDAILLETHRTRRARLLAAFLYGELSERRVVNDNVKRLVGSVVLAAVICAGCVGFSVVTALIADRASQNAAAVGGLAPATPIQHSAAADSDGQHHD